jgi:ADP-ribosylglycohydrolase/catechol 2,3-dioxygenase-like lactoylglutathione lyase family enzyme
MMASPLNRGQRVRGALVGVAVGDALGWPQEQNAKNVDRRTPLPEPKFRSWTRRAGGRFQPFEEHINAGEFSDDTQLTLCIARSLLHGNDWLEHFTRKELPTWALYERGGGRSVLRAAGSWATGHPPWSNDKSDPRDYFATGANGVAMRVLPHVAFGVGGDFDAVRHRIVLDACATHGHAAALIGALLHASSLWHALRLEGTLGYGELLERLSENSSTWADQATLDFPSDWIDVRRRMRGDSYEDEWSRAVDEAHSLLEIARDSMRSGPLADDEDTLKRLGVFDRKVNGSGIVTAVGAALIASRSASSPELGLVQSAFLKGADTDTLASMTAALLGAIAGLEWLNGLRRTVQDGDYLVAVAHRLVLGEAKSAADTTPVTKSSLDRWTRSLAETTPGTVTEMPGGREVSVEAAEDIPTKSASSTTVRYRLRAVDGETLYIVKHSRSSKKDSAVSNGIRVVGVRVRVSSLSESRRFYEEVLGLSASRTGDTFARYGDVFALEVAPPGSEKLRLADPDFLIHLETQDVEALHAAVRSSAVRVVETLREEKGRSRFTCSDPDGHLIEIVAPQAHR